MLSKTIKAMRRRVGPVGLSLLAAAITATAFAAISVAAKDGDGGGDKQPAPERGSFEMHVGPPPELSDEDQAKLEEFRQCMEDNGAPALPEPGEMRERLRERLKKGELPEPPGKEEIEKLREAHEACEDKLPEDLEFGFGAAPGGPGCGPGGPGGPPPDGAPNREGTAVPAPPSGGSQGDVMVAPQGSTS